MCGNRLTVTQAVEKCECWSNSRRRARICLERRQLAIKNGLDGIQLSIWRLGMTDLFGGRSSQHHGGGPRLSEFLPGKRGLGWIILCALIRIESCRTSLVI